MGKICAVPHCSSGSNADRLQREKSQERQASLFTTPKSPARKKQWEDTLNCTLTESDFVCEFHFSDKYIRKTDKFILADGTKVAIPRIRWALDSKAVPGIEKDNDGQPIENYENRSSIKEQEKMLVNTDNRVSPMNNKIDENKRTTVQVHDSETLVPNAIKNPWGEGLCPHHPAVQQQNLDTLTINAVKDQLSKLLLPEACCWMQISKGLTFTFHERETYDVRIRLEMGEDLSMTIITKTGRRIPINRAASIADIRNNLRIVEKVQICSGTGMKNERQAPCCLGILDSAEEYRRLRPTLRCRRCHDLRKKLQKRINRNVSTNQANSADSRSKLALVRNKCMHLKNTNKKLLSGIARLKRR